MKHLAVTPIPLLILPAVASTMLYASLGHAEITGLELTQNIATYGAHDWESFVIGENRFLAVANYGNDSTRNVDSVIYRWSGASLIPTQNIPTSGALDWEAFTMDGVPYLAVANYRDDTSYDVNSKIFRWSGNDFVEIQSIPTSAAVDWESFSIDGVTYLAVSGNGTSTIYRWDGTLFSEFQSFPTNWSNDAEYFSIGGDHFLGLASAANTTNGTTSAEIFRWDGTRFAEYQVLNLPGVLDLSAFSIGQESYLATAVYSSGTSYNTDSIIYRWDGSRFLEQQRIATHGAADWTPFEQDGDTYLSLINYHNDTTHNVDSKIYRWDGSQFAETLGYPTHGGRGAHIFSDANGLYLAVANHFDDRTFTVPSQLYRLTETFSPITNATTNTTSGAAPLTVELDATASSDPDGGIIVDYQWLTSDAQSAVGPTASFTFDQPGSYSIQLTVIDDEGQSAEQVINIQVNALDATNCEGRASYSAATGELHLPLMEIATVPILGGVGRPAGDTSVPTTATLRIIPGTTLFEIESVTSTTPDAAPAVPPCHADYSIDGVLDVPLVDVPVVTAIGGLTVTTGVDTYHATLELLPMSDLFQLTAITLIP